jgi:hypothetical protein
MAGIGHFRTGPENGRNVRADVVPGLGGGVDPGSPKLDVRISVEARASPA